MFTDKQLKIMKDSMEYYGHGFYMIKIMEELAELSVEVAKCSNGTPAYRKIVDEMADVTICLHYLQLLTGITTDELEERVEYKINRTDRRMRGLE